MTTHDIRCPNGYQGLLWPNGHKAFPQICLSQQLNHQQHLQIHIPICLINHLSVHMEKGAKWMIFIWQSHIISMAVPPKLTDTFCPSLTIPWRATTLVCLNWPMMAPSCRNLILSASFADDLRVLMATSCAGPVDGLHTPLWTVPNWPDPRLSVILGQGRNYWKRESEKVRNI